MKLVVLVLVAIAVGIAIYRLGGGDPGYVHFYYGGYSVELSVATFALLFIVAALIIYVGIRLLRGIWRSPRDVRAWNQRRQSEKAQDTLGKGMLKLIEGDWKKAEKLLLNGTSASRIPAVHYLAAAQAAQEQGSSGNRDRYISLARDSATAEKLPVALTQARLHQQAGQMDQALEVLREAGGEQSGNPQVTAMLVQAYDSLGKWEELRGVLPRARSQQALPEEVLARMERRSWIEALAAADDADVEEAWKALPRPYRRNPRSVRMYAELLMRRDDHQQAEKLIREALQAEWDDQLIRLYGLLESEKPQKLLRAAERWELAYPDNAALQLALARRAIACGDDGQARRYLDRSVALGGGSEAYAELGRLSEKTSDVDKALEYYRRGLERSGDLPDAPVLPAASDKPGPDSEETSNNPS